MALRRAPDPPCADPIVTLAVTLVAQASPVRLHRLDVTLSDGRQSATFRITPVAGAREAWAILEAVCP